MRAWIRNRARSKGHCCICGDRISSQSLFEDRPSGFEGKTERWFFCLICFPQHKAETAPRPNEFVQYKHELKFPIGG